MRLVPWDVPVAKKDPKLPEKLKAERSGILAWAVRGCLAWQKQRLQEPEQVKEATEEYREESDRIGEFLRAHCKFEDGAKVAVFALREAIERYFEEIGERNVPSPRAVGERLRKHDVGPTTVWHDGKVKDGWRGIRLLTDKERRPEVVKGDREEPSAKAPAKIVEEPHEAQSGIRSRPGVLPRSSLGFSTRKGTNPEKK
jgi:putative DNA primase/helicase